MNRHSLYLLVPGLLLALVAVALAASAQTNPPGGPGDWSVADSTTVTGPVTVTLTGNLYVQSGGDLKLDRVTLLMNSGSPGQYIIEVKSGGRLTIENGTVAPSVAGNNYRFSARSGSVLRVASSTLTGAGTGLAGGIDSRGVAVETSDADVRDSLLASSYAGLWVEGGKATVTGTTVRGSTYGVVVRKGTLAMSGGRVTANSAGLTGEAAAGYVRGTEFDNSTDAGVDVRGSNITLENLTVHDNGGAGVSVTGGSPLLVNLTVLRNYDGVQVFSGTAALRNCLILNNSRNGLLAHRTAMTFDGGRVAGNRWYGLSLSSTLDGALFANITVAQNGMEGVHARLASGRITGSTISTNGWLVIPSGLQMTTSEAFVLDTDSLTVENSTINNSAIENGNPVSNSSLPAVNARESRGRFYGNFISGFKKGFDLSSSTMLIEGNRLVGMETGVNLVSSTPTIRRNTFIRNGAGVVVDAWSAPEVADNAFMNSRGAGVWVEGGHGRIHGNTFTENQYGIYTNSDPLIEGNTFRADNYSLYLEGSSAPVRGNTFENSGDGGGIVRNSNPLIEGNTFRNAISGLALYNSGGRYLNNTFYRTWNGISVNGSGLPLLRGNIFTECGGAGVFVLRGSAVVEGNTFDAPYSDQFRGVAVSSFEAIALSLNFNIARNMSVGFRVAGGGPLELRGNTVAGSVTHAVSLFGTAGLLSVTIVSNNLSSSGLDGIHGVRVALVLEWNILLGNEGSGLYLEESSASSALDVFDGNGVGVFATGSTLAINATTVRASMGSGLEVENSTLALLGPVITDNIDGVLATASTLTIEAGEVRGNTNNGLFISGSSTAVAGNTTFHLNWVGVEVDNSTLLLRNSRILNNRNSGLHSGPGANVEWDIAGSALLKANGQGGSEIWGNITVRDGGTLVVESDLLFFGGEAAGDYHIEVLDGGTLNLMGAANRTVLTAIDTARGYLFWVRPGGTLVARGADIHGAGSDTEGELWEMGLYLQSGQVVLDDVLLSMNQAGLVVDGTAVSLSRADISHNTVGLAARHATVSVYNSSFFSYLQTEDIRLDIASTVRLVNTTFRADAVLFLDRDSVLKVFWYADLQFLWAPGRPAALPLSVEVQNRQGWVEFKGTVQGGSTGALLFSSYEQTAVRLLNLTPHRIAVSGRGVAQVSDAAVNRSGAYPVYLNDSAPALLNITSPRNGSIARSALVLFEGTASDAASGVERVELSLDGVHWFPVEATTLPDGSVSWVYRAEFEEGYRNATVRAFDTAGNRVNRTVSFWVKPGAPLVYVSSPANGTVTTKATVTLAGIVDPTGVLRAGGNEVAMNPTSGAFSVTLPLAEGENNIAVEFSAPDGAAAGVLWRVVLDTTPPGLALDEPVEGFIVNTSEVRLIGRVVNGTRLTANGEAVDIDAGGAFSAYAPLRRFGDIWSVKLAATDAVGNRAERTVNGTVDDRPPLLTVVAPTEAGAKTKRSWVNVTGLTDGDAVLRINGVRTNTSDGRFSEKQPLRRGKNTLTFTAEDPAGNIAVEVREVTRIVVVPPDDSWMVYIWNVLGGIASAAAVDAGIWAWRRRAAGKEGGEEGENSMALRRHVPTTPVVGGGDETRDEYG